MREKHDELEDQGIRVVHFYIGDDYDDDDDEPETQEVEEMSISISDDKTHGDETWEENEDVAIIIDRSIIPFEYGGLRNKVSKGSMSVSN